MNKPILTPTGTDGPPSNSEYSLRAWGQKVKGQRLRSHEAETRFGGLAEASFSAPLIIKL